LKTYAQFKYAQDGRTAEALRENLEAFNKDLPEAD
jgi:hypothetical protein